MRMLGVIPARGGLQKQDLPPVYMLNRALYVRRREVPENWSRRDFALGKDVWTIIMDKTKSIDIDTLLDLMIAKQLLKGVEDCNYG